MGRRNRREGIMESLERDIAIRVSQKEVERLFEDGKPHEVVFFDAILVDGQSLATDVHQPTFIGREVASYDEFGEAFHEFTELITKAQREILRDDFAAIRACAKAGLIFATETMRGEDMDRAKMAAASQVLGTALTAQNLIELERAYDMPDAVRAVFVDYLEGEWPTLSEEEIAAADARAKARKAPSSNPVEVEG